ncbi:hypothetical protein Bpfe_026723 [Biomphalaria pfeifferi]|uniref:CUB domain-containing protein n=1 Tax=Biomphalaria pfeifferi TaxID=112525 RepID=A0AAD8AWR0_BIOPF|nr:hypothetical protein Bpfe_026723 [Biomphalaria pfeifferi]
MEMDFKTWMTRLLKILIVCLSSCNTFARTNDNTLVLKFEAKHSLLSGPILINFNQKILKRFILCLCDESVEKCTAVASNINKNSSSIVFTNASRNKSLDKSHHRYRRNLLCKSQFILNSNVGEFRLTCSNTDNKCQKDQLGINIKGIWDTRSSLGNDCLACGLNIFWNDYIKVECYDKSILNINERCTHTKNKSTNATGKEPDHLSTSRMTSAGKKSFCKELLKTLENTSSTSSTIQNEIQSSMETKGFTLVETNTIESAVTNQSVVTNQIAELTTVNVNMDVLRYYENNTDGIQLNVALQEHLLNYSASKEKTSSSPLLMIAASITGAVALCALIAVIVFVAVRRKKKALQSARRYSLPRSQSLDETKTSLEV